MTSTLNLKEVMDIVVAKLKQPRVRRLLLGLYVLVILGLSATVRASQFPLMDADSAVRLRILPVDSTRSMGVREFVGQVFSEDKRIFLQVGDEVYELRSLRDGDLQPLNGRTVQIFGYEYKHRSGPVYQTASLNPLQSEDDSLAVAPVVFVLKYEVLTP